MPADFYKKVIRRWPKYPLLGVRAVAVVSQCLFPFGIDFQHYHGTAAFSVLCFAVVFEERGIKMCQSNIEEVLACAEGLSACAQAFLHSLSSCFH